MNGALTDELSRRGLFSVVGETNNRAVGRALAAAVLYWLADHANARNLIAYGTPSLAQELGLDRRTLRAVLEVLEGQGLIRRTGGKRGRAVEYLLDVEAWPSRTHRPARAGNAPAVTEDSQQTSLLLPFAGSPDPVDNSPDVAGHVAGYVAGQVAGQVARYPATKGREVNREGRAGSRTEPKTPTTGADDGPPPSCKRHPHGWHHDDPCHPCMRLRRWYESRPAPAGPRVPDDDEPTCGECGLVEAECRRRERVSGHTWRPDHPMDRDPSTADLVADMEGRLPDPRKPQTGPERVAARMQSTNRYDAFKSRRGAS